MLAVLLQGLSRRYQLSEADVNDAIAEVERRLLANSAARLQNFAYRCHLEEWLGVVTLNVVRERMRAEFRRREREQRAHLRQEALSAVPEHEQLIERLSAAADVAFAREGLDPLTWQILRLRFEQGFPWQAIAQLTGLSERAVTSRAYRALESMQQRLQERDTASSSTPSPLVGGPP